MQVSKQFISRPTNSKKNNKSSHTTRNNKNRNSKKYSSSKSKSPSRKENYHHKNKSPNQPKVSPLHLHKQSLLNTSPNLPLKLHNSKSKKKYQNSARQLPNDKNDKYSHSISTKLVTERSPTKKKKSSPPSGSKNKRRRKQNVQKDEALKTNEKWCKKLKKPIPAIKTKFSNRKQSFLDPELIEKFQERKSDNPFKQNFHKTMKVEMKNLRTYGTCTSPQVDVGIKDLQFLRKEAELKWRIVYLELSHLKFNSTPQKLEQMIYESEKNLSAFKQKSRELISSSLNDQYMFESPAVIQKALRRQRKSVEETKELVKNLSDQRLLQELQMIEGKDGQSQEMKEDLEILKDSHENEKPSNSSFCIEFEKQLELFQKNVEDNQQFQDIQLPPIPDMEYSKANTICELMELTIFLEVCQQIIWKQKILHAYLLALKNTIKPPISANGNFSLQLSQALFEYIKKEELVIEFLARLNIPFGNSPEINLKWIRNYFNQSSEDDYENIQISNKLEPVIDPEAINNFTGNFCDIPSEEQYFYNHCVFACLGQILDTYRPFGLSGLPPLCQAPPRLITNYQSIFNHVLEDFKKILRIRMGRISFEESNEDPLRITQRTYELMDQEIVKEEEMKWKGMEDGIFQKKYELALNISDIIINEEVLIFYNEFI